MTRRRFVAAALAARPAPFSGTFLQLYDSHRSWAAETWDRLFAAFRALGLRRVIVQWTEYDSSNLTDLLPSIFDRCGGLSITLGLRYTNAFWKMTEEERGATLAECYQRSRRLIERLASYVGHPAFGGWYIPQEFDDTRWARQTMKARGGQYLRALAGELRKVDPRRTVSASAFANGVMPPGELARLWRDAVGFADLDELLFQDGVGAAKLTVNRSGEYFRALSKALGNRLTPVVELFETVRADPFEARPAAAPRIREQLSSCSEARLSLPVAFSVPEYLSPLGGPEAVALFDEFRTES